MTAKLINSSKGRSIKILNIVHESPTLFKVCEGGGGFLTDSLKS